MNFDPAKLKVLLAEDAISMRKIEIKLLKKMGITQIVEAIDGEAAVEILKQEGMVDLIISDWNMPNRSGLSFLKWTRAEEKFRTIPFLMATAQSDKEQENKAKEAGANAVLAKPFSYDELLKAINAVFGGKEEGLEDVSTGPRVGSSGKVVLRIAHIQITDHIILGVLKHLIETGAVNPQLFELETQCMPGWNPVGQAIDSGAVEGALILAPIAMDLFSFGTKIKLVLFAHRGGSIFVRSSNGDFADPHQQFYKKRSFLIPHKLSIHHMLTHMFFHRIGLNASLDKGDDIDVNLEVSPPVKMPAIIKEDSNVSGFMVAEPIGTKTIATGAAHMQFLSNELWNGHPCCVVAVRDEVTVEYGDAVGEFVKLLVNAGDFVMEQPGTAADIAVKFLDPQGTLGLKVPVLKNVLMEPNGIKTDNLYPVREDLDQIQKYMVDEMGVGRKVDLDKLVDLSYAEEAYKGKSVAFNKSFLNDSPGMVLELLQRGSGEGSLSKTMLNKEGKYLTFCLSSQEFGIDILNVKEIIGLMEISGLPQAHEYIKGVINLRDRVIPVMDLRLRFGMEIPEESERNCIIIVEAINGLRTGLVGLIVDAVSEVLTIKSDDIEETPAFTSNVNTNYILAMAKKAEKVKILLNMEKVLTF